MKKLKAMWMRVRSVLQVTIALSFSVSLSNWDFGIESITVSTAKAWILTVGPVGFGAGFRWK